MLKIPSKFKLILEILCFQPRVQRRDTIPEFLFCGTMGYWRFIEPQKCKMCILLPNERYYIGPRSDKQEVPGKPEALACRNPQQGREGHWESSLCQRHRSRGISWIHSSKFPGNLDVFFNLCFQCFSALSH